MNGSQVAGPDIQCILDSSPDPRENSDLDTTNIQSAFRRGLPLSDLEYKLEKKHPIRRANRKKEF